MTLVEFCLNVQNKGKFLENTFFCKFHLKVIMFVKSLMPKLIFLLFQLSLKNGVKSIQTAGYNGAPTVYQFS